MRGGHVVGLALAVAAGTVVLAAPTSASAGGAGTVKVCSDVKGKSCGSSSYGPGDDIFLHVELSASLADAFKGAVGEDVGASNALVVAVAKTIDDDPILTSVIPFKLFKDASLAKVTKQKTLNLRLQVSDKTAAGIAEDEIMARASALVDQQWVQVAKEFPTGSADWGVFVVGMASSGNVALLAEGKLTYKMTADGKKVLTRSHSDRGKDAFKKSDDDGVKTGVHKDNVGKVVFAATKLDADFDDKSALTASTKKLSGGLYARVYLKQSLNNEWADHGQADPAADRALSYVISVDDGALHRQVDLVSPAEQAAKATSFGLTLVPGSKADDDDNDAVEKELVYLIGSLSAGKHTITVTAQMVSPGDDPIVVATGSLEVKIDKKDRDKVAKAWGYKWPAAGLLKDKKLAKGVKKAWSWKDAIAWAMPYEWHEVIDANGALAYRWAHLYVAHKTGDVCTVEHYLAGQRHEGSKWTTFYTILDQPDDQHAFQLSDVPCANIKKK